jgi:CheY-like chemotaxis protein
MAGQVSIESRVGQGSTFSFTARLPRAPGAEAPHDRNTPDLSDLRVVIVDDNATTRLVAREILESCGAEVVEAPTGRCALDELDRPHKSSVRRRLLLVDAHMPAIDGVQLHRRLRTAGRFHDLIVLMENSGNLASEAARLDAVRVDGHVVKPLKRSELLDASARALCAGRRGRALVPPAAAYGSPAPSDALLDRRVHVLIADDSHDNRALVRAYLRTTPYVLDEAVNGREAVARFTSHRYDVVLMDIQMPVMDGFEAVRAIRRWEQEHDAARTPIIALTASAFEEAVREAREAGCDVHLSKPVKKQTLLRAIRDAVPSRPDSLPALSFVRVSNGSSL